MPLAPETFLRRTGGRDRVGRVLLALAALAAVAATVGSGPAVLAAGGATVLLESWRLFGFVLFAGIFALLARDPHGLPGTFELAIAHKIAMTIAALAKPDALGASDTVLADGLLTAALIAAYASTRGWNAWRPAARRGPVDRIVTTDRDSEAVR